MVPFDQPSPKARVPTWPSLALQHSINKMRMIYNYIYSSYYSAYNAKNVEFDRFDFKFCSFLTFNKGVKHIISKFLIYIIYFILIHCPMLSWIYWKALNLLEIPWVFWSHLILKIQNIHIYIYRERERERETYFFLFHISLYYRAFGLDVLRNPRVRHFISGSHEYCSRTTKLNKTQISK